MMSSQNSRRPAKSLRLRLVRFAFAAHIFLFSSGAGAESPAPAASDEEFLRQIQKDSIQYFLDFTDPETGLTWDSSQPGAPSSIAATGFALPAFAIAQEQGWISYQDAYSRILKALKTFDEKAQQKNGFFYHFLDPATGKRTWGSEISSIDTALAIAGALVAAEYFPGTPLQDLAKKIYDRIDWNWMLNGTDLLCMGWKPESGFLPYYWDSYNELIILQALAIGAANRPVPPGIWNQWNRFEDEYNGKKIVYSHTGSLFTYQYSHAFIDFRGLNDGGIDYFENSKKATIANKEFCLENAAEHQTYGEASWGLTACLGPGGYKAYGAKPGLALHDGTVAPSGSLGSIVFEPAEALKAARFMRETYGEKIYGKHGFTDAYNLDKDWFSRETIGIDQGITVLMIENYLTEGIWSKFMRLEPVEKWIELSGLRKEKTPARDENPEPA